MLTELCAEIRNYFLEPNGIHTGKFTISGGKLAPLDFIKDGQYIRIIGSTFNDGVYQYPAIDLTDETFAGAVWALAIPPAVKALADEIKAYNEGDGKPSAYTSESFGNYSYTKATDASGAPLTWEKAFAKRLNKYRRMNIL
ncbi:MAG: hypothetical protein IIX86_03715 [Clostridia bacterium]|nr:hypothetical protein [Clostridia bacterium]